MPGLERIECIYVCRLVGRNVCCRPKCVGEIKWPTRMLKVILGWLKLTCDTHVIYFDYVLEQYSKDKRETLT